MKYRVKRQRVGYLSDLSLTQLLISEGRFRLAVLALLVLVVFLALFLPRIWRVTPRSFRPVIKVSGLDWVQAWSLQRTARREMARGRLDHAWFAWRAAVEHHPADAEALGGMLETVLRDKPSQSQTREVRKYAQWLLELTSTNQASLLLVARLGDRLGQYEWIIDQLGAIAEPWGNDLAVIYLKALFQTRRIPDYAARWVRANPRVHADPEMQLYQCAYQLGWGAWSGRPEAKGRLAAALANPGTTISAARLMMLASVPLGRVDWYEDALVVLEKQREDRVMEQVRFWRMLAQSGRGDEAKDRARSYQAKPTSPGEVLALADGYRGLGWPLRAKQLLAQHLVTFGQTEGLWLAYANLLIADKSWDELRTLALEMRQTAGMNEAGDGFSHYLEGRVALEQGKRETAEAAFQKALRSNYGNGLLGMAAARGLVQAGYPTLAMELLLPWRQEQAKNLEYWQLLCRAAYESRQAEWLLVASEAAYRLSPDDPELMNNYAAALLISRQRPAEAIRLTVQLWARNPHSLMAKVNHSLAMIRNGRAPEAAALLQSVSAEPRTGVEANAVAWAQYELCQALGEWDAARQAEGKLERNYLFPEQANGWRQTHPAANP